MAVKKTAAKKTTTKKSPAKKSASKPAKSAAKTESTPESLADRISNAIISGEFDGSLEKLDDALNTRINVVEEEKQHQKRTEAKKQKSATAEEKRLPSDPKKKAASVKPESGKTYLIAAKVKGIGGAKVKFHRFKADSDEKKSVVEIMEDKPGAPKGKRFSVPTNALENVPAKRAGAKRKK